MAALNPTLQLEQRIGHIVFRQPRVLLQCLHRQREIVNPAVGTGLHEDLRHGHRRGRKIRRGQGGLAGFVPQLRSTRNPQDVVDHLPQGMSIGIEQRTQGAGKQRGYLLHGDVVAKRDEVDAIADLAAEGGIDLFLHPGSVDRRRREQHYKVGAIPNALIDPASQALSGTNFPLGPPRRDTGGDQLGRDVLGQCVIFPAKTQEDTRP